MADAFYLPIDEHRFASTPHTKGPWVEGAQHAGPPSGLLARAIERTAPRDDMQVARVTIEILGPVPVAEIEVHSEVARPGRSVELVTASMTAAGREVMQARAWRIRRTDAVDVPPLDRTPDPVPEARTDLPPIPPDSYSASIDLRFARGSFSKPGPAMAWMRMRHPLVPDEEPSPLVRTMVVADSGNGVSQVVDFNSWFFINPELTVHLHREPVGEWICLDATTTISTGGVGLAASALSDERGPFGRGAQSLYIAPR